MKANTNHKLKTNDIIDNIEKNELYSKILYSSETVDKVNELVGKLNELVGAIDTKGIKMLDENGNPIKPPYITFSIAEPEWDQKASMFARVWDRTTSNARIIQKADQITAAIGIRKKIHYDGGYLVIWPETPRTQIQVDGDTRYAYINLAVNHYNLPGV